MQRLMSIRQQKEKARGQMTEIQKEVDHLGCKERPLLAQNSPSCECVVLTLEHISKKQCIFHREIADRQWLDCIKILDRLPRCHKGTRTKATSAPPKPKVLARRRVLRGKGGRARRLLLAAPCKLVAGPRFWCADLPSAGRHLYARGLKGFSARRIWFRWKEKLRKWREDRPARRIAFRWNAVLRGMQAARST